MSTILAEASKVRTYESEAESASDDDVEDEEMAAAESGDDDNASMTSEAKPAASEEPAANEDEPEEELPPPTKKQKVKKEEAKKEEVKKEEPKPKKDNPFGACKAPHHPARTHEAGDYVYIESGQVFGRNGQYHMIRTNCEEMVMAPLLPKGGLDFSKCPVTCKTIEVENPPPPGGYTKANPPIFRGLTTQRDWGMGTDHMMYPILTHAACDAHLKACGITDHAKGALTTQAYRVHNVKDAHPLKGRAPYDVYQGEPEVILPWFKYFDNCKKRKQDPFDPKLREAPITGNGASSASGESRRRKTSAGSAAAASASTKPTTTAAAAERTTVSVLPYKTEHEDRVMGELAKRIIKGDDKNIQEDVQSGKFPSRSVAFLAWAKALRHPFIQSDVIGAEHTTLIKEFKRIHDLKDGDSIPVERVLRMLGKQVVSDYLTFSPAGNRLLNETHDRYKHADEICMQD